MILESKVGANDGATDGAKYTERQPTNMSCLRITDLSLKIKDKLEDEM